MPFGGEEVDGDGKSPAGFMNQPAKQWPALHRETGVDAQFQPPARSLGQGK